MKRVTAVVLGAGHSGLAMSRALGRRSVDHLVLEGRRIGESWRTERWDGLRLLTPNWMSGPAGHPYRGPDPEGFMSCGAFVTALERAAALDGAPVRTYTRVLSLAATGSGYRVGTDRGGLVCDSVVIATGAAAIPRVPDFARDLPADVRQLTPLAYKRPTDVPDGGVLVVGASASGLQIARDLTVAGRRVLLAVGNHLRLPRRYRDADILWWMDRLGILDVPYQEADLVRLRRLPSLPLAGDPEGKTLDLDCLQDLGVEIAGRLMAIRDGVAWFSGSLPNACATADLKLRRLLKAIDAFVDGSGIAAPPPYRLPATRVPEAPRLCLRLRQERIATMIWATGYEPDHSFLRLPVFDARGRIRHEGGVVREGLYVMGLRYLRTARSSHIAGAAADAEALATHLVAGLARSSAA